MFSFFQFEGRKVSGGLGGDLEGREKGATLAGGDSGTL